MCIRDRNKTNIANSSSLPNNIPALSIHLEKSGKVEKFPLEPITEPRPGPTLDIDVAAPEIEVIKSRPLKDKRAVIKKKSKMYKYIKDIIEAKNLSLTLLFSYLITKIPLGKIIFFNWLIINLYKICILNIFTPHVVDPAHPPINIKIKKKNNEKLPHWSNLPVT